MEAARFPSPSLTFCPYHNQDLLGNAVGEPLTHNHARGNPALGHRLKLDPKVTADQRGHGVGVAIQEYTKTSMQDRAAAAKKLEESVLGKIIRMPKGKAS